MYVCELCKYSTDTKQLYHRHLHRTCHIQQTQSLEYSNIDLDFLLENYVEQNYDDGNGVIEIHNLCKKKENIEWYPIEIYIGNERNVFSELGNKRVLESLLYVLYGKSFENNEPCKLKCKMGELVIQINRSQEKTELMEYIDGEYYPMLKKVDEYVVSKLGNIDDFRKKYIYNWKEIGPRIELDVDRYIENANELLERYKKEKYDNLVVKVKEREKLDKEIEECVLDIESLHITPEEINIIEKEYTNYKKIKQTQEVCRH